MATDCSAIRDDEITANVCVCDWAAWAARGASICLVAFVSLIWSNVPFAAESAKADSVRFLFVTTNESDSAKLGTWPLDRAIYAAAIARAKEGGAKAVVLKFFFDRPSSAESDKKLLTALGTLPVYLQFTFQRDGDGSQFHFRARREVSDLPGPIFDGPPGSLPPLKWQRAATDLGFVNALPDPDNDRVEIVGSGGGHNALSLQVLAVEAAFGQRVRIGPQRLRFADMSIPISSDGRIACRYLETERPVEHSLFDFLNGATPKNDISSRVVIIGNTRDDTPRLTTSALRTLPIHEVFFRQVLCLERLFSAPER